MRIRSILSFSFGTLLSRLLGFVRELVFAYALGATAYADAVVVAVRIPTMLRGMLAEGVSQNAFVPVLKRWQDLSLLWAITFIIVGAVLLVIPAGEVLSPMIVKIIAPGFLSDPEKYAFTVKALRITFPSLFFISAAAISMGILNTRGEFFKTGLSPVFFNMGSIVVLLFAYKNPLLGAFAFTFGTFLQFLFLFYFSRVGFQRPNFKHPAVKEFLKNWLSMSLNSGFLQISTLINSIAASFLATGTLAYLSYAFRLIHLPQGLFGVATANVLTKSVSEDEGNARKYLWKGLLFVSFTTLSVAILYAVLGLPVVKLAFVRGRFTPEDARRTYEILLGYLPTIPAFAFSSVYLSYLFALFRRREANIGFLVSTLTNLLLVFPMAAVLGAIGIAYTVSISNTLSVLYWSLRCCRISKESLLTLAVILLSFFLSVFPLWVS